jgi:hypothetical protein
MSKFSGQQGGITLPPTSPEIEAVRADEVVRTQYVSFETAVVVPTLQALVSGALVGATGGLAAGMVHWDNALWVWGLTTFGTASVLWLAMLDRWQKIQWEREFWRPEAPQAQVVQQTNNVERISVDVRQDNRTTTILHLNVSAERLAEVAKLVLNGRPFVERSFCGSNGLLSQTQFREMRDELIQRGLLTWRNPESPQQGTIFEPSGYALMRRLAGVSGTPPPYSEQEDRA